MMGRVGAMPGNWMATPLSLFNNLTSGNCDDAASNFSAISFGVKCACTSITMDFIVGSYRMMNE